MNWIRPSEIDGSVDAPPSKSLMIRAVAAGFLCEGETRIHNPSHCDDAQAALGLAKALGVEVEINEEEMILKRTRQTARKLELDCGESGLCIRMFAPVCALSGREALLLGRGSLLSRPVEMVEKSLSLLGCTCSTDRGKPPIFVKGPLKSGQVAVDGSLSSQFLTGLLMALPLCEGKSELKVYDLKSKPYTAMTLSLLSDFGINIDHDSHLEQFSIDGTQKYLSRSYSVEGDWSGISALLVAGAARGRIKVNNLSFVSSQADKKILDALLLAGADVRQENRALIVEHNHLDAFEFDASSCPDLFPALTALACSCRGHSYLHGIKRLFFKESNRAESLLTEFSKMGADIQIQNNTMRVLGKTLIGGEIDCRNDHRIAMAAAVAGLTSKEGVFLRDWQCVAKSYPGFFEDLKSLIRKKQ